MNEIQTNQQRNEILTLWAKNVFTLLEYEGIKPESVQIEANAAMRMATLKVRSLSGESKKIYRILGGHQNISAASTVPWEFRDGLAVTVDSRWVRMDCPYQRNKGLEISTVTPDNRIVMSTFARMQRRADSELEFITGLMEDDSVLVAEFSDNTPHFLCGGGTGSGKSSALQWVVLQFAVRRQVDLILLDGKGGSFGMFDGMEGLVGPVATELTDVEGALAWAERELTRRNQWTKDRRTDRYEGRKLVIFFDEFQEFVSENMAYAIRRITSLGRSTGIHLVLSTQRPSQGLFRNLAAGKDTTESGENVSGESIKGNMPGRIGLKMQSSIESGMIMPSDTNASCTSLLGKGDCWVATGPTAFRVQMVYASKEYILEHKPVRKTAYSVPNWSHVDVPIANEKRKAGGKFDSTHLVGGLKALANGIGRPTLKRELDIRNSQKVQDLQALTKQMFEYLDEDTLAKLLDKKKAESKNRERA